MFSLYNYFSHHCCSCRLEYSVGCCCCYCHHFQVWYSMLSHLIHCHSSLFENFLLASPKFNPSERICSDLDADGIKFQYNIIQFVHCHLHHHHDILDIIISYLWASSSLARGCKSAGRPLEENTHNRRQHHPHRHHIPFHCPLLYKRQGCLGTTWLRSVKWQLQHVLVSLLSVALILRSRVRWAK